MHSLKAHEGAPPGRGNWVQQRGGKTLKIGMKASKCPGVSRTWVNPSMPLCHFRGAVPCP